MTGPIPTRLATFRQDVAACTTCRDHGLLHRAESGRWAYPLVHQGATGSARVLIVAEGPNAADTFSPDKARLTYTQPPP